MLDVLVYNKSRKESMEAWSTKEDVCKKEEASSTVGTFCTRPKDCELTSKRGSLK